MIVYSMFSHYGHSQLKIVQFIQIQVYFHFLVNYVSKEMIVPLKLKGISGMNQKKLVLKLLTQEDSVKEILA